MKHCINLPMLCVLTWLACSLHGYASHAPDATRNDDYGPQWVWTPAQPAIPSADYDNDTGYLTITGYLPTMGTAYDFHDPSETTSGYLTGISTEGLTCYRMNENGTETITVETKKYGSPGQKILFTDAAIIPGQKYSYWFVADIEGRNSLPSEKLEIRIDAPPTPSRLYLCGNLNGWTVDSEDWKFATWDDTTYVWMGDLPANTEFRIHNPVTSEWYSSGCNVYVQTPYKMNSTNCKVPEKITNAVISFHLPTRTMTITGEGGLPPCLYLIGAPQGWVVDSGTMTLEPTYSGSGIYTATFDISYDKFMFRFYQDLGNWETNSLGACEEELPLGYTINMSENYYFGSLTAGKGSWKGEGWTGGQLAVTVDLRGKTVKFSKEGMINYEHPAAENVKTLISQGEEYITVTWTQREGADVADVKGYNLYISGEKKNSGLITGTIWAGQAPATPGKYSVKVETEYVDDVTAMTPEYWFEITSLSSIEASEEECEWYTISGIKVSHPTSGLYLRRQGNTFTKHVLMNN